MRYERKYRIEAYDAQALSYLLARHPAGFKTLYPDRRIHNIYFDTPNLQAYRDNVAGVPERRKFRVRWYGWDIWQVQKPHLELKHRQNDLGDKLSMPLSPFDLRDLQGLKQEVLQNAPRLDGILQPVLLNSYHRAYYGSADGRFRLTVDTDLCYAGLWGHECFRGFDYRENAVAILEIKYEAADDVLAEALGHYLPFRRSRNSKSVNGVQACLGG